MGRRGAVFCDKATKIDWLVGRLNDALNDPTTDDRIHHATSSSSLGRYCDAVSSTPSPKADRSRDPVAP